MILQKIKEIFEHQYLSIFLIASKSNNPVITHAFRNLVIAVKLIHNYEDIEENKNLLSKHIQDLENQFKKLNNEIDRYDKLLEKTVNKDEYEQDYQRLKEIMDRYKMERDFEADKWRWKWHKD